jgi:FtsZ-interacting cell division protein ZipA
MTAIRKTYMAKFFQRMQMTAMVDGKPVLCDFKTVSRNPNIKGMFSTNNPKLMEALEKDVSYNVTFSLHSEENDQTGRLDELEYRSLEINPPEEDEDKKEEAKQPAKPKPEKAKAEVKAEEVKVEPVEEVKAEPEPVAEQAPEQPQVNVVASDQVSNVQEAKEYLKTKFPELTARQIGSKALVLEIAKEKGIVFEALK